MAPAEPDGLSDAVVTIASDEGGGAIALQLVRHSVRAESFRVRSWTPESGYVEVAVPPSATFVGNVVGEPRSVACVALRNGSVTGHVVREDGTSWQLQHGEEAGHTLTPAAPPADLVDGECGCCGGVLHGGAHHAPVPPAANASERLRSGLVSGGPGSSSTAAGQAPPAREIDCIARTEIAFDSDYEYFQLKNSSIPQVVASIEDHLLIVNAFYARDVLITHEITDIIVREAPFYANNGAGEVLDQFRAEWIQNQTTVQRDLTHLMTDKDFGGIIGLAWVNGLCNSFGYAWSRDSANIIGHELGHNWGQPHCLDTARCNSMCGGCFYFGPETRESILSIRNSAACLDPAPAYPTPLPPYSSDRTIQLPKYQLFSGGPLSIDVVGLEGDGNCQRPRVVGFDTATPMGGSVIQASGALVYSPPTVPFVGKDVLRYRLGDGNGLITESEVVIESTYDGLEAWWTFDEGQGDIAYDASGNGNDAVADLPGVWGQGVRGGAFFFDGTGQILRTEQPAFDGNWTVSTWVKRSPSTGSASVLLRAPGSGSILLEQQGDPNRSVGVTEGGSPASFSYVAPVDTWVHLAFVGEDGETKLYVNGEYHSSVARQPLGPLGPFGTANRWLAGWLDDTRVWRRPLGPNEVRAGFRNEYAPESPTPKDGGFLSAVGAKIRWAAPNDAYDIYMGRELSQVLIALPHWEEYRGRTTDSFFDPPMTLTPGETWYWRIFGIDGQSVRVGDIWRFDVKQNHRWPLDELGGGTAVEPYAGLNGSMAGNPILGVPSARPDLGTAIQLDGIDDHVAIPAPGLDQSELTISCWIRRNGTQNDSAGLVFSRDGGDATGIGFGSDGVELRYHWSTTGNYTFSSGLFVPDNEWVFVALVVKDDSARLYMGSQGVLSWSDNAIPHSPAAMAGEFRIGHDATSSVRRFRGAIDDVRLDRVALGVNEIRSLFQ